MSWAKLFSNEPIDWFESSEAQQPVPTANEGYKAWLDEFFPTRKPESPRHIRLWKWFDSLKAGVALRARVDVWPRGGAKSSTAEMGTAYVGCKLSKRFCLYVSGTQNQANKHVQSIGALFEKAGVERATNKYNHSRGWSCDILRTATGFNVVALGLDAAARGIKLDEFRPDLIIFDDIDDQADSPTTVAKKIATITGSIIPTGSAEDTCILFVQNLIHEESIVSQLVDGRADFLHDRELPTVEPAVQGLEVERVDRGDGAKVYKIIAGTHTWVGQDLATCERQINDWGFATFKREAQHEVRGADGFFFNVAQIETVSELPQNVKLRFCRAWDLAATEGGGDFTAGVLLAIAPNGIVYAVDVQHKQYGSDKVKKLIRQTGELDLETYGDVTIRLPQDPGQAGVYQAAQMRTDLCLFSPKIEPVTGKKGVRARGLQEKVNSGNFKMLAGDWNHVFKEELRKFREDEEHEFDDQVDGGADAYNELAPKRQQTRAVPRQTRSYV